MTNAAELKALIEAGDLHGLMLAVNRAWLRTIHPDAEYAALGAHIRDGVPDVMVPIIPPQEAPADEPQFRPS